VANRSKTKFSGMAFSAILTVMVTLEAADRRPGNQSGQQKEKAQVVIVNKKEQGRNTPDHSTGGRR